jgi:phage gp45-like
MEPQGSLFYSKNARFEVFMAVKIQVEALWVVMPRSVVAEHQHFRGQRYLHVQGEDGGTLVFHHGITQHHNSEDLNL